MTTNILGTTPNQFRKMLSRRIHLCIAIISATLMINLFLAANRSNETHHLFLMVNILLDLVSGFFLIYYVQEQILPQRRLFALFSADTEQVEGTITDILPELQRYRGIDCHVICVGERRLFLPADTVLLQVGQQISARLVYNMILEVTR